MLDADGPRVGSDEPADREPDDDADVDEVGGAYERAQPDSQPPVSSEPEPDDDPANAG